MFKFWYIVLLLVLVWTGGCGPEPVQQDNLQSPVNLDTTVGAMVNMVQYNAVPVRGFGIVAGLNGTGSAECPPALRAELEKYIQQQLPERGSINPRAFLDSSDTAVVEIVGTIPPLSHEGQTFDVQLIPLSRTETTSLDGGYLYTTPLKERSVLVRYDQYAKTFAVAQGQVFRNTVSSEDGSGWYLLGGGIVRNEVQISLVLKQPNYLAAHVIRNRINERFGARTAQAISPGEIRLKIPARFQNQKLRFLQLVQVLYLADNEILIQKRVQDKIDQLRSEDNKLAAELAVEAFGKPALDRIAPLLADTDPKVRFHAARCMLNIGDDRPIPALSDFCRRADSPFRIEAIAALGEAGKRKDAEPVLISALESEDIDVRLAAYEQLLQMRSFIISRSTVAESFSVDRVYCGGPKVVYAYRQGNPRIVIFNSPVECEPNIYVHSQDNTVTINARPEDKYLAVSRRHPNRPRVIGPVSSGRELSALIRTLGESSETAKLFTQPGLAVPYHEIVYLLNEMAEHEAIKAKFTAGPLTGAGTFVESSAAKDR